MKTKIFFITLLIASLVWAENPYKKLVVALDGSGDYTKIQEAINSLRDLGPGEAEIFVKNGVYNEKIRIPSWKHQITIIGENKEKTIIINSDFSGKLDPKTNEKMTTFDSYTLLVEGDDIRLENFSIQNTHCTKGQAVALHVEGDRFVGKNLRLLGCQDTLYAARENSRQFYFQCYIEGTTDFIFGEATAFFEDCTIKSLTDSYVTAAATTQNQSFGFVFNNCKLIAADGVSKAYLGRPWRSYAKTVFLNSEIGSHILPEGWDPWTGDNMFPDKDKTVFYAEFHNYGTGAIIEKRVNWSKQLSKKEAKKYTIGNVFKSWNPKK